MRIDLTVCPSCHKEKSCHDLDDLMVCMQNFIKNELRGSPEKQSFNHSSSERN